MSLPLMWRKIPERYLLVGSKCETCKGHYFPIRNVCPKCRRKGKIVPFQFSGKGKVYSYTLITAPPAGFELDAPYILAIIDLEEGARVTAQVVDCEEKDVKIGAPVESVFRKIQEDGNEGLIHYGFKFKLSKK
ncbi:MAG: Zn-ribbon domain-containing OB-fold protein [Candidatus Micrarchaeota archaeon]